jgi:Zn-dependent protease
VLIWAVPVLFSVIIHEVAHGGMAYRLGDPTAKNSGRLTLNPAPHIDIIGTVILPFMMIVLGGPVFGWAKPVPVNPRNFRPQIDIKNGMMWVALAGPCSNLALALISAFFYVGVMRVSPSHPSLLFLSLSNLAQALLIINLVLALFNLVPIPPLDGSKVLLRFLPHRFIRHYLALERYGFLVIVLLLASGVFSNAILGPIRFLYRLFLSVSKWFLL